MPVDATTAHALDVARRLAAAGIPIFVAVADPTASTGYRLPPRWQDTVADPGVVDTWQPGAALALVTGHGLDLLDFDTRSGGDPSHLDGMMPTSYGAALTPSGGAHSFIASLGARSRDKLRPGIDVKAGLPDGAGRGFAFIAPTVRTSKVTGEPTPYRWAAPPDLERLAPVLRGEVDDDSGAGLRALIAQVRNAAAPPPSSAPQDAVAFEALTAADQDKARRYTERMVEKICAELKHAAQWAPGETDEERKRGWEKLTADAAWRLGALARAAWSPLTVEDAWSAYTEHAPTDDTWSAENVAAKWRSQWKRAAPLAWPKDREAERWAPLGVDIAQVPTLPVAPPESGAPVGTGSASGTPGHNPRSTQDAHLSETVVRRALLGRYCWAGGLGWMAYRPATGRWAPTEEPLVLDVIRRDVIAQVTEEAARGEAADPKRLAALSSAMSAGRIGGLLRLTKGQITIESEAFDRHPDLLCVGNGVVNLETGELGPHDAALLMTKGTPVEYRPGALHSDWAAALCAVPEDVAPWLQLRLGQAATGHPTSDDVLPVLQGSGSNGKTTLMGAVLAALGDYAVSVPERVLMAHPSDHPTELMTLRGARVALIEETPEGRRLNVKRLKDILGTPTMTARAIRRDNVTWRATHSLVLTTNYTPAVAETDHGTWRRLALVRFPYTFLPPGKSASEAHHRESVVGIRERLLDGVDGVHEAVLAWVIDGARGWYAAGRVLPQAPTRVLEDTHEWRSDSDLVLSYFNERLVIDPDAHVMSGDLYEDFARFLVTHGQTPWSEKLFSTRFAEHDAIVSAGIAKARRRPGDGLSRPVPISGAVLPVGAVPNMYTAWSRVRFVRPDDHATPARSSGLQVVGSR